MIKEITHNGKTLKTKFYRELSDEEYNEIVEEYYKVPSKSELYAQFRKVANGGSVTSEIYKKYFIKIASDVCFAGDKFSINEVLESKELVGFFMAKAEASPHIFNDPTSCKKFMHMVQLGGKGVARKATQFPIQVINYMLENYCPNKNYYDYSCGWGARLLGSMRMKTNYYGTDPNVELVEQLGNMYEDYYASDPFKLFAPIHKDIRPQGSEIFVEEWTNKMGLCFSSPPYFDLEDYKHGEQSIKLYPNYKDWLNVYVRKTMENCKKYLVDDGFFAYNIKNTENYKMADDFHKIATEVGFVFLEDVELSNGKRVYGSKGDEQGTTHFVDTNEKVYVYRKSLQ